MNYSTINKCSNKYSILLRQRWFYFGVDRNNANFSRTLVDIRKYSAMQLMNARDRLNRPSITRCYVTRNSADRAGAYATTDFYGWLNLTSSRTTPAREIMHGIKCQSALMRSRSVIGEFIAEKKLRIKSTRKHRQK